MIDLNKMIGTDTIKYFENNNFDYSEFVVNLALIS